MNMQNFLNEFDQWLYPFEYLLENGKVFSPRGEEVIEVENFQITMNPLWNICKFKTRKINLGYIVGEMLWYMRGSRNDTSILYYSSFWDKIRNHRYPIFNSNYGYYAFTQDQLKECVQTLLKDKDSRQAIIIISTKKALETNPKDVPCTYAVSFRIRDNKLNMSVSMRSNDIWRGFCVDMFQFSIWQQIVFSLLQIHYKELTLGTYTHKVDSFHIYTNHISKAETIIKNGITDWDYSIDNAPMVSISDQSVTYNALNRLETELRETGQTNIEFNSEGFSAWAAKQLHIFTQNKNNKIHGL